MKKQLKTKKSVKLKAKLKTRSISRSIKFVAVKHPVLRHFRLIESKHTARRVHHRHTSYVGLLIILIIFGIVLLAIHNVNNAEATTISQSVTVTALVPATNNPTIIPEDKVPEGSYRTILDISVPIYLLLLALVIGFWLGDIFDRYTNKPKSRRA